MSSLTAWFTSYFVSPSNVIFTMNLETRQLMPQVIPVAPFPKSIFLTPDGTTAWVLFFQGTQIYVVDTLSMTVVKSISAGGIAENGLAFSPDGTRAYVAINSGAMNVFDTASLTQIASIPLAVQPGGIVVSKDGSRVYVDSLDLNNPMFSVIDAATNTVVATYPQIGAGLSFIIFN